MNKSILNFYTKNVWNFQYIKFSGWNFVQFVICTWRTHLRSYLESNFDVVNVRMEVFDMVEQMCADPLGKRGNSTLKLQRHTRKSSILRKLLFFQLLTGCPNKFGIMFWSLNMNVSEASIVYDSNEKNCTLLQKIAFSALFPKLQNWKWLLEATFFHYLM